MDTLLAKRFIFMMIFDVRLLTSVVVFLLFCGPSTIFAGVLQPKNIQTKKKKKEENVKKQEISLF